MAKKDTPSVATYADHEVITPPHPLRKAVSTAPASPDDDPLARAEAALAELSGEFSAWMDSECDRLDAARDAVKAVGFTPEAKDILFRSAHDIKGEAATFGYPAAAAVSDSLCRLIEHTPDPARIPLNLVDQHVDAVRAIVREKARPDAADVAAALTKRLRRVTDDFLVQENKSRPGYLDGIVAPPITPEE